jgi:hypothetical protein
MGEETPCHNFFSNEEIRKILEVVRLHDTSKIGEFNVTIDFTSFTEFLSQYLHFDSVEEKPVWKKKWYSNPYPEIKYFFSKTHAGKLLLPHMPEEIKNKIILSLL